jgi:hypothetical protein
MIADSADEHGAHSNSILIHRVLPSSLSRLCLKKKKKKKTSSVKIQTTAPFQRR